MIISTVTKSQGLEKFLGRFIADDDVSKRQVSALSHPLGNVFDGESSISPSSILVQSMQSTHSVGYTTHDPRHKLITVFEEYSGRWLSVDFIRHIIYGGVLTVWPVLEHYRCVAYLQTLDVDVIRWSNRTKFYQKFNSALFAY